MDARLIATGWFLCPMDSGSKNPGSILGKDWPSKCSNDPAVIAEWPEGCNIGVLLGSKSGVIDLEFDDDNGEMLVEAWMEDCGHPRTPTYRSAKSVHRLFQWEDRFELEGAKFGMMGVEFRFGQNAAQSVIPPSIHESGAKYEWIIPPWECDVAPLPELVFRQFMNMKQTQEKRVAKAATVDPRYTSGDSLLTKARNWIEQESTWESILMRDGWTFCRNRQEAQDWWRPGKKRGSISGTVNFGGSKTLRVFSTSVPGLKPESSYDKFAYLCATQFNDDPVKAAFGLVPEAILGRKQQAELPLPACFDDQDDSMDASEFYEAIMPQDGLIRWVYEYYKVVSQFPSPVMGMATALSFCETIFGRRITSQTDLRTNDYNVVMAPTGSGKEACEATIQKLFAATGFDLTHPPDVQSGNGLLSMINVKPCGIWVCDEFGKTLESLLDKRSNQHLKQIATHLLKLYGKASTNYGGAAHSAGAKNKTLQPHLCVLGLTTPKVFSSITADQVDDGLFGRLAFFVCQDRPKMVISPQEPPSEILVDQVKRWIQWDPKPGNIAEGPDPALLQMTAEAFERWTDHSGKIRDKMDSEGELRAGVWCRTAARTMKLAMVHRAARLREDPSTTEWGLIKIEKQDIEWAVLLSNFLTRTSCNLLLDDVVDNQHSAAADKILKILRDTESIEARKLYRSHQKFTAAQFHSSAKTLEKLGLIRIECIKPVNGGRSKVVYTKVVSS
jgi:hypothetical protein